MIVNRINQWARLTPDRTALVHDGDALTYADFARTIEATRRGLEPHDPAPGRIAVVVAMGLRDAWRLVMAARAMGLHTVSVLTTAEAEALGLKSAACILTTQAEASRAPPPQGELAGTPVIILPDTGAAIREGPVPQAHSPRRPLGGHILFSSGTTGVYKKVFVDGPLEDGRNAARADNAGITRDTVFHGLEYGLWTGIGFKTPSAVWLRGGTVVLDQRPDKAAHFLDHPVTYAQTTPETLRAILDSRGPAAPPAKGLRLRCGGGFVPLSLAQQAMARLSPDFTVGFSSTELATALMESRYREPDDLVWLVPDPRRVIEVADENGDPCPPGVEGELRAALTPLDHDGYLGDPDASARFFRDGYFYTGDLAVRREDGRIRVLGRAVDVINIKGRKQPVGPIEQSLQQSLGVDEVCLFTGLAEDGVEEIVVAVQTRAPEHTAQSLAKALGGSAIWERMRVVVLPEFPRTETGLRKTRRPELRRMLFPGP